MDSTESLALKIIAWFRDNALRREEVRKACMSVIDKEWNPYYQIEVFKKILV